MPFDEVIGGFLVAIASGVVMGIAALLLIYKMVDRELPVGPGLVALIIVLTAMGLAIHPPHPIFPGAVLLLTVTLIAFFPFAENILEEHALRELDADRLERTLELVRTRPDNYAAKFDLGKQLYRAGFRAQAITLTASALSTLDSVRDDVRNQSLRDIFRREEIMLKRWMQEPVEASGMVCPACGNRNTSAELYCSRCGRPHLLDLLRSQDLKRKVWARLAISWAALALFIPLAVVIAVNLEGVLSVGAFIVAFGGVGWLLWWLFRPPVPVPASS